MIASSNSSLQFLGGAGTVTGSRYLIETGGRRLLVDCGLFQGYKWLRERNWAPFPVPAASIDTLLLTHAHLDHSGYIPALVRQGFRGQVICTAATRELCSLLLPDSGYLLEEEARYAKRKGFSKHKEPLPLYTQKEALASLKRFETRPFGETVAVLPGVTARFSPAGHILGAAQISLEVHGRKLHFTGDLGRNTDALMKPPAPLGTTDVLVCESTYGNRVHPVADVEAEIAPIIRRVVARGGVIVIPAFAVGRAQSLTLHLARLRQRGEIPDIPIFLNSPMAVSASEIYHRYQEEHRVTEDDSRRAIEVATMVRSTDESKALNQRHGPMIIISASGMLTGGRVLHHLVAFGPDPRNAILLAGYQAGGTRGASLAAGAKSVRIFGQDVAIGAEVVAIQGISAHADSDELIEWMRAAPSAPGMTYLTHGEPDASDALRRRVEHELGRKCRVPEHLDRVALGPDAAT